VLRRQPGLLAAWRWNWRHLGQMLAALERRIAAHARRQRSARWRSARWRSA